MLLLVIVIYLNWKDRRAPLLLSPILGVVPVPLCPLLLQDAEENSGVVMARGAS